MKIKMAINSQLSTTESKKLSKQAEQEQNHRNRDHLEGYHLGEVKRRIGEKVQGLRSTNLQVQNRQGDVKNSIGNGEAKDLIYMNHGHKLKGGFLEGKGGTGWKGEKGEIGTTNT